MTLMVLMSY